MNLMRSLFTEDIDDMDFAEDYGRRRPPRGIAFAIIAVIVLLIIIVAVVTDGFGLLRHDDYVVDVNTVIKDILEVSELATYTAVYNGIATVADEDDPDEIEYYVSYEATVDAGIDFSAIVPDVDEENKIIYLSLPEVNVYDPVVDISSLDFIFVERKSNESSVTSEAYSACEADAQRECSNLEAIRELAGENAENVVLALTEPIFGAQYDIEILSDGGEAA